MRHTCLAGVGLAAAIGDVQRSVGSDGAPRAQTTPERRPHRNTVGAFGFDPALAADGATNATTAVNASTTIDRLHAVLRSIASPLLSLTRSAPAGTGRGGDGSTHAVSAHFSVARCHAGRVESWLRKRLAHRSPLPRCGCPRRAPTPASDVLAGVDGRRCSVQVTGYRWEKMRASPGWAAYRIEAHSASTAAGPYTTPSWELLGTDSAATPESATAEAHVRLTEVVDRARRALRKGSGGAVGLVDQGRGGHEAGDDEAGGEKGPAPHVRCGGVLGDGVGAHVLLLGERLVFPHHAPHPSRLPRRVVAPRSQPTRPGASAGPSTSRAGSGRGAYHRSVLLSTLGSLGVQRADGTEIELGGVLERQGAVRLGREGRPAGLDRGPGRTAVFGEEGSTSATIRLHNHISRLRKRLGPSTVVTVPRGYRLDTDVVELDWLRFESSSAAASDTRPTPPQQRGCWRRRSPSGKANPSPTSKSGSRPCPRRSAPGTPGASARRTTPPRSSALGDRRAR